jgi:RHS repeat-associated protein
MRVVQERDGNNVPTVSYTRGNDLSMSLQGAGGIGGLLARSSGYSAGNWTNHADYYADGNGNITSLIDGNQTVVASYRYDPFGNIISKSGSLADANVYRFSSKEIHVNSGMYYYGFRFYEPNLQRWINRDPIEEAGGINLYTFCLNELPNRVDPLGNDMDGWICGNPNGLLSGIGSAINETGNTYPANASQGRHGRGEATVVAPGPNAVTGGGYGKNPRLNDLDFVFPTPTSPINGKTDGAFKIGSNMAIIKPDPKPDMPNNAKITGYTSYWPPSKCQNMAGYPK